MSLKVSENNTEIPGIFSQVLLRKAKEVLDDPTISCVRKQLLANVGLLEILASAHVGLIHTHMEESAQWHQVAFEEQACLEVHCSWAKKASACIGEDVTLQRWLVSNGLFLEKRRLMPSYEQGHPIYRIRKAAISSDTASEKSSLEPSSSSSSFIPSTTTRNPRTLFGQGIITLLNTVATDTAVDGPASNDRHAVWFPLRAQSSFRQDLVVPDADPTKPESKITSSTVARHALVDHLLQEIRTPEFKAADLDLQIEPQWSCLKRDYFVKICSGGLAQLRVCLARVALEDPEVDWDSLPSACLEILLDALLDEHVNVAMLQKLGYPRAHEQHSVNETDWANLLGGLFWILSQHSRAVQTRKRPAQWVASNYTSLVRSTYELTVKLASEGLLRGLEASDVWKAEGEEGSVGATTPAPMSMMALAEAHSTSAQSPEKPQIRMEEVVSAFPTPLPAIEEVNHATDEPFELLTMMLPSSSSRVLREALIEENSSDHDWSHSELSDSTDATDSDDSEATQLHIEQTLTSLETTAASDSQSYSSDAERPDPESDSSDLWDEVQIITSGGPPPVTQNGDRTNDHPEILVEDASNTANYSPSRALDDSQFTHLRGSAHSSASENSSPTTHHVELRDGDNMVSDDVSNVTNRVAHPTPATIHPGEQSH